MKTALKGVITSFNGVPRHEKGSYTLHSGIWIIIILYQQTDDYVKVFLKTVSVSNTLTKILTVHDVSSSISPRPSKECQYHKCLQFYTFSVFQTTALHCLLSLKYILKYVILCKYVNCKTNLEKLLPTETHHLTFWKNRPF